MKSSYYLVKNGKLSYVGDQSIEAKNSVVAEEAINSSDSICSAGLLHTFKRGNKYVTEIKY
jgi:hypothetical protein